MKEQPIIILFWTVAQNTSFKKTAPVLVFLSEVCKCPENFGTDDPQQHWAVDKLQNSLWINIFYYKVDWISSLSQIIYSSLNYVPKYIRLSFSVCFLLHLSTLRKVYVGNLFQLSINASVFSLGKKWYFNAFRSFLSICSVIYCHIFVYILGNSTCISQHHHLPFS